VKGLNFLAGTGVHVKPWTSNKRKRVQFEQDRRKGRKVEGGVTDGEPYGKLGEQFGGKKKTRNVGGNGGRTTLTPPLLRLKKTKAEGGRGKKKKRRGGEGFARVAAKFLGGRATETNRRVV